MTKIGTKPSINERRDQWFRLEIKNIIHFIQSFKRHDLVIKN